MYAGDSCTITHELLSMVPFSESEGYVIQSVTGNVGSWNQQSLTTKGRGYATITYGKPLSVKEYRTNEIKLVHSGEDIVIPIQSMGKDVEVRIIDIQGRIIESFDLEKDACMVKISTNRLYEGLYCIMISSQKGYSRHLIS